MNVECVGQGVGQVLDMSPVLQVQWALGWMLVEAFKQSLGVGVEMYRDVSRCIEMYRDVSSCIELSKRRIVWRAGDDVKLPSCAS